MLEIIDNGQVFISLRFLWSQLDDPDTVRASNDLVLGIHQCRGVSTSAYDDDVGKAGLSIGRQCPNAFAILVEEELLHESRVP